MEKTNHLYSSVWCPTWEGRCKLLKQRSTLVQYALQRGSIEESWYKWNSQFFLKRQRTNTTKIKLIVIFASGRENTQKCESCLLGFQETIVSCLWKRAESTLYVSSLSQTPAEFFFFFKSFNIIFPSRKVIRLHLIHLIN